VCYRTDCTLIYDCCTVLTTRAILLTFWQEPLAAKEREMVTISASTRQTHMRAPASRRWNSSPILFAMGRFITYLPCQPTYCSTPGFYSGGAGSRGNLVCLGHGCAPRYTRPGTATRLDCFNLWWTCLNLFPMRSPSAVAWSALWEGEWPAASAG
jgi:hypothetical protein